MALWRIAIRALAAYVYLLVVTRAAGKRLVSQATPFDFVLALIVGDMIDDALWAEVSMAKFAVGVGALFACDAVTKLIAFRSRRFCDLVSGKPVTILRDGVEDRDALRGEQLNEGDLQHLLRLEGIDRRKDVREAMLEDSDELSVLRCPEAEAATKEDLPRVKRMMKWAAS